MATETGYFKDVGGEKLFYQCWLPGQTPLAALVVVHGLGEHSGRYMNLVNAMVPKGFAVYALDHYGHGRSGGRRMYVPRFQTFLDGLDHLVDRVREWEPERPVFLVGHSMGGLITSVYLQDRQDKVQGAVLSGPGVKVPDHVTPITRTAARIFSRILPGLGVEQLNADDISRDPDVVRAYVNDPLVSTGKVTARLAAELLAACERAMSRAGEVRLPLLILQGGADALVDPDGAEIFHRAVGSADKSLTVYPDKFHEIFNDPGYEDVFRDMAGWIQGRL